MVDMNFNTYVSCAVDSLLNGLYLYGYGCCEKTIFVNPITREIVSNIGIDRICHGLYSKKYNEVKSYLIEKITQKYNDIFTKNEQNKLFSDTTDFEKEVMEYYTMNPVDRLNNFDLDGVNDGDIVITDISVTRLFK